MNRIEDVKSLEEFESLVKEIFINSQIPLHSFQLRAKTPPSMWAFSFRFGDLDILVSRDRYGVVGVDFLNLFDEIGNVCFYDLITALGIPSPAWIDLGANFGYYEFVGSLDTIEKYYARFVECFADTGDANFIEKISEVRKKKFETRG